MPSRISSSLQEMELETFADKANAKRMKQSKARISAKTRDELKAEIAAEMNARYAAMFNHINGRWAGRPINNIPRQIESDYNAPAPKWIKTQNLVRNRTKRINGKVYQRSVRWCAGLEHRSDRMDQFDEVRLFQHGAHRSR